MEEKMYDALARAMLAPQVDNYGNKIPSPLEIELNNWANNNRIKIAEKLLEKIDIDTLADAIEKRVKDAISIGSTDRYLSGYDRENYQSKLNDKIMARLVELIAQKKLAEFTKDEK